MSTYTGIVLDDALGAVGNTPLIRLDRIAQDHGLKCNLFAKPEFLSIGGSVKDRIAKRMVLKAEEDGILIPGKSVVIEPTSGNTGIGLALACAIKGYAVVIVMPEKMSMEKELTLRTLGADIVRTPTTAPSQSEFSNLGVAKRLAAEIPGGVILDQYGNPNNPLAHELTTGPEIIAAIEASKTHPTKPTSGKVDVFVAGAGTGGTLTGTSKALKETHNKDVVVVGIDPKGSILAQPESLNKLEASEEGVMYQVEGIGYDFIPDALNHKFIDTWVKTEDEQAWAATSELHRREGLLVGGSSGSILAGALSYLKSGEGWTQFGNVEGKNVVIILPDGIRNYMSKPWFKEFVEKRPPSAISAAITQILGKKKPEEKSDTA